MRRIPLHRLALTAAALLVAGACGGGGGGDAAPTTTTVTPTTIDDYVHPPGTSPLTGLPFGASGGAQRPALVIKIDNAPKARPQIGLNQADLVIEEKVEDGVTRFFTVFHATDVPNVGPVRSARTTDIFLAGSLNRPLFAYSGTNPTAQRQLNTAPLVDVGIDRQPREYRRDRSRPAPYNLFSSTASLRRHAPPGAGPPAPQFRFRGAGQPLTAEGATPFASVHIEFLGDNIDTFVDWRWDAAGGVLRRTMDGVPHTDPAGDQVTARNVIVQFVDYIDTGIRDQSNTAVPEGKLVGSGEAWVITDGKVVRGRWSKPGVTDVTTFTGPDGRPVPLTPGRTWVELSPGGAAKLG